MKERKTDTRRRVGKTEEGQLESRAQRLGKKQIRAMQLSLWPAGESSSEKVEVERESNTAIPIDEERADAVGCPTQPTPKPKLEGSREADEDAQLSQGLHRENEQKAGPRRVGRAESEEGELPALFQEPGEDERVLDEPDSVHSVDRVAEPQEVLRMGEARAFVGLDPVLDKLARLLLSDLEKQEPK